jgi:hypothetical protein
VSQRRRWRVRKRSLRQKRSVGCLIGARARSATVKIMPRDATTERVARRLPAHRTAKSCRIGNRESSIRSPSVRERIALPTCVVTGQPGGNRESVRVAAISSSGLCCDPRARARRPRPPGARQRRAGRPPRAAAARSCRHRDGPRSAEIRQAGLEDLDSYHHSPWRS